MNLRLTLLKDVLIQAPKVVLRRQPIISRGSTNERRAVFFAPNSILDKDTAGCEALFGPHKVEPHGALSIQQKFRFEISEILRAQWNGTFRLRRPNVWLLFFFVSRIQKSGTGQWWMQGGLATAFDLAAFLLSMIAPVKKSVNHSRTVASMRETGWEQQQHQEVRLRKRLDSATK